MTPFSLFLAAATLAAGTAAALMETAGRSGYGVLKMTAASGYLGFALTVGALDSLYGRVVLAGLLLSWLGDFFLIGESRRRFLGGLGAFLLAHVAYAAAFLLRGPHVAPVVAGAAAMAVVAGLVLRWLRQADLPAGMLAPVGAYLLAIGLMVALAAGTGAGRVLVGAVAFAASDLFVARQRFVVRAPLNRRIGLPLYFAGQLLIAASV